MSVSAAEMEVGLTALQEFTERSGKMGGVLRGGGGGVMRRGGAEDAALTELEEMTRRSGKLGGGVGRGGVPRGGDAGVGVGVPGNMGLTELEFTSRSRKFSGVTHGGAACGSGSVAPEDLLTPSPSLSTGSSDNDAAALVADVDYDQAYRMLAVTLGLETSRDGVGVDVSAGVGVDMTTGGGNVGDGDAAPRAEQPQFPTQPGAHGFMNPLSAGAVTMATPPASHTTPSANQATLSNVTSPVTSQPLYQQQQRQQAMSAMLNHHHQGNVFPDPGLVQSMFGTHGNGARDTEAPRSNYKNPLVTFMNFLHQHQQQSGNSNAGCHGNNSNNMAGVFNNLQDQLAMENMFNYSNGEGASPGGGPIAGRKNGNMYRPTGGVAASRRGRLSSVPPAGGAGRYNLHPAPIRGPPAQPAAPPPWGFYLNRDAASDAINATAFPTTTASRLGCSGNG